MGFDDQDWSDQIALSLPSPPRLHARLGVETETGLTLYMTQPRHRTGSIERSSTRSLELYKTLFLIGHIDVTQ